MKTNESVIDFPKDGLCPEIWELRMNANGSQEEWGLIPEVYTKLVNIVQYLYKQLKVNNDYNFEIGAHITGSITSNSYTENADIDLHLYCPNTNVKVDGDILSKAIRSYFKNFKTEYPNDGYIGKHPIEVYFQENIFQDMMSVGCYDLLKTKWVVGPEIIDKNFNPYSEFYNEIQAKSKTLVDQIRNMILSIYEITIIYKKNINTKFGKSIREILINKLTDVQKLYDKIRNMRKVYSSPTSEEQALKYRSSRKWKIADASFKLFDKYGYMAILKQFVNDYELISNSSDVDFEVIDDILSTVKNYINNPEKLADSDEVEYQQVDEGAKDILTLSMLIGMLAINGILPAAELKTQLKNVDKTELRANNPKFKEAIAKATKGKSYNGMNTTNIINAVARTIYAEAKGEGKKGQAAVASVIWNRSGGKCKKLISVISKKKQFSCWNDYSGGWTDKDYTLKIPLEAINPGPSKDVWDNCVNLAKQLATENFTSTIGNRNSYMNKSTADKSNVDSWGKKLDLKIGKHDFGYLSHNDGFGNSKKSKAKVQPAVKTHTVKVGDTLAKIAKANKTTVDILAKKNKIVDPNKIKIGQSIII